MTNKTAATRGHPPLTGAGIASYRGVLAAYEITIVGTLPEGKTTANVTYYIVDTATNTLVGTVQLPDAVEQKTAVSMTVKVAKLSASFAIGTLENGDFRVSRFLSVRSPPHTGAVGAVE